MKPSMKGCCGRYWEGRNGNIVWIRGRGMRSWSINGGYRGMRRIDVVVVMVGQGVNVGTVEYCDCWKGAG